MLFHFLVVTFSMIRGVSRSWKKVMFQIFRLYLKYLFFKITLYFKNVNVNTLKITSLMFFKSHFFFSLLNFRWWFECRTWLKKKQTNDKQKERPFRMWCETRIILLYYKIVSANFKEINTILFKKREILLQ